MMYKNSKAINCSQMFRFFSGNLIGEQKTGWAYCRTKVWFTRINEDKFSIYGARYIFVLLIFIKRLQNWLSLSIWLDHFVVVFVLTTKKYTWIWHGDKLGSVKKSLTKSFMLGIMKTLMDLIHKKILLLIITSLVSMNY